MKVYQLILPPDYPLTPIALGNDTFEPRSTPLKQLNSSSTSYQQYNKSGLLYLVSLFYYLIVSFFTKKNLSPWLTMLDHIATPVDSTRTRLNSSVLLP